MDWFLFDFRTLKIAQKDSRDIFLVTHIFFNSFLCSHLRPLKIILSYNVMTFLSKATISSILSGEYLPVHMV